MAFEERFLCTQADLGERQSLGFDPWDEGRDTVLLVRHGGEVHGWRDACPHYGGTAMAWRKNEYLNADRNRIVCAAHGAQFDTSTGRCVLGPCLGQSLQPIEIFITNEQHIYIRRMSEGETGHDIDG
jgi:nitrite reductase/ring-hydroxylating ferredoxin subunit